MEFPDDVLGIIRAFTKPLCRVDWRKGSYIARTMITPESNFHSNLLMAVHEWRDRNLDDDQYDMSMDQLYDMYEVWKDTYHVYFYIH